MRVGGDGGSGGGGGGDVNIADFARRKAREATKESFTEAFFFLSLFSYYT